MTDKTTELIAEAREMGDKRRTTFPPPRDLTKMIRDLADALEKSEALRDHHALQEAGLRDDITNLEAECDTLRDQLDMLIENSVRVEGSPVPWVEIDAVMWDRILSRAIDTKGGE